MCKNCAQQLSPWFSERRHSTVAEIGQQLQGRAINQQRVAAFRPTRSYGTSYKLIIDDNMGAFIVTRSNRWMQENPDVIDYACLTGCDVKITESRSEITRRM